MARIKKSPSQRQKSENLRARAVTITPIHRESIIKPNHTSILPRASGTMVDITPSVSGKTKKLEAPKQSNGIDEDSGWMTRWCAEPRGDTSACCMAFWVPYALYGKVDWRLRRVAQGEDPLDESWKARFGCNSPCWIYVAFDFILPRLCISGILVGLQRSQIRGTYGIPGSIGVDIARGIFCPMCTLVHNDREVRAREGQDSLRNNPKYDETLVTEQPSLNPRMQPPWAARSSPKPRPTSGPPMEMTQTNTLIEIDDANGPARYRGGCEKTQARPPRKESQEQRNEATIMEPAQEYYQLQSANSQMKLMFKQGTTTKSQTEDSHNMTKAEKEAKTRPDMKSGRFDGRKRSQVLKLMPTVIVTGPQDLLSKEHNLMGCSTVQIIEGVDDRSGPQTHRLADCTTAEDIQKRKLDSHKLADCNAITKSSTDVQPVDCDKSTVLKNQELSYVHDFTDCPVDKAVLEYYEKQEKIVQSHVLAECARGSSADNARLESEVRQHKLASCARCSVDSLNKLSGSKSHNLEDCPERNSASTLLSNNPYIEHSLAHCSNEGPPSSTVQSDKQYRSASGTFDSTSKNTTQGGIQHRLSSCPTPIAMSRNRSSDDSEATKTRTNLFTAADQRNTDVGSDSGISDSHLKVVGGQICNRQRRRHKGKGKASENVTKPVGEESS